MLSKMLKTSERAGMKACRSNNLSMELPLTSISSDELRLSTFARSTQLLETKASVRKLPLLILLTSPASLLLGHLDMNNGRHRYRTITPQRLCCADPMSLAFRRHRFWGVIVRFNCQDAPCLAGSRLVCMRASSNSSPWNPGISNNLHTSLPQAGSVRSTSLIDSPLFCRK
jgi:hypothetical protein